MTVEDLKRLLGELLAEEECASVDWDRVQDLSIAILSQIRAAEGFEFPVELVVPYLTEFELRRADATEAGRQQALLVAYLRGPRAA